MKKFLLLLLLIILPAKAWGYACISAGAGNWSDPSKWSSCNSSVPGNGDTATITHAIAVDVNTVIGNSPAAGNVVLTLSNTTGTLTINAGVSLTIRGDFYQSGPFTMAAGSILEFDSSLSSSPSTTSYEWRYAITGSVTTITINGTTGSRCTIRSNAGGKNAFVNCTTLNFKGWTETNCDWYRFGGNGTYSIMYRAYGASPVKYFSITGSTYDSFDKEMYMAANDATCANTNIDFDKIWIKNSAVSPILYLSTAASPTGHRKLTNSSIDKQVLFGTAASMIGWTLDGSIFYNINGGLAGTGSGGATCSNCTFVDLVGTTGPFGFDQNSTNTFTNSLVLSHNTSTTHQEGIFNTKGNLVLNGGFWEASFNTPEANILTSSNYVTNSYGGQLELYNWIEGKDAAGNASGMVVELKGDIYTKLKIENCTFPLASATTYEWGVIKSSWGSNSIDYYQYLQSFKNNLFWNPTGGDVTLAFGIDNAWAQAVISGTAGGSSSTTVLYYSSIFHDNNTFAPCYWVKITSGPDAGLIRQVASSTATTITVSPAFPNTMASRTFTLYPLDAVLLADYNAWQGKTANGNLYDSTFALYSSTSRGYTGLPQTTPSAIGQHDTNLTSLTFIDSTRSLFTWSTDGLGYVSGSPWVTSTSYAEGATVSRAVSGFYGGKTINYRCYKAHTSSSSDAPGGFVNANWRTYWEPEGLWLIRQNHLQRSGYDANATQANFLTWVKTGYTPISTALRTAGSGGTFIGAILPQAENTNVPYGNAILLGF